MRNVREGLTIACVLLVSYVVFGAGNAAADRASERAALQLIRASHLAATGQCAEAMSIAEASPTRDAESERLIGKCALQAEQYSKALVSLKRAEELDPSLDGLSLYTAIALYHLEEYADATATLEGARAEGEEVALIDFYSGLLLLRDDRARESALAFERAARLGPDLVEPVASYYAALAWQSLDENEPLNSAADRVMSEEPGGVWAREARSLLTLQANRHRRGQTELQRWASLKVGLEYDSNVVLRGSGFALPSNISSDNDVNRVWSLVLGAELFEVKDNTVGAMFSYSGNAHDDVSSFDQHYIGASAWIDRELRPTTLGRLRANVGYGWFDEDPFVVNFDISGLVEERWGRWGTTRCSLGMEVADYRYELVGTFASQIDQDGVGVLLGCDHELPVNLSSQFEPTVYGGYHFKEYFADGIEWDHIANSLELGLRAKLPAKIDADVSFTYTRRDYEKASAFAAVAQVGDKHENNVQFDFELAREFNDWIEISGRYQYLNSGSKRAKALSYKRHIVGVYIELKYP